MTCKEIELQEDTIAFYQKHIYALETLTFKDDDAKEHLLALKKSLAMLQHALGEMISLSRKRLTPIIRKS